MNREIRARLVLNLEIAAQVEHEHYCRIVSVTRVHPRSNRLCMINAFRRPLP